MVFALAAIRWGATSVLVPFLFLVAVLVVVSLIDLEHYRIPDRIVFPALGVSVGLIVFVSLIEGFERSTCATRDRGGGLLRAAARAPPRLPERAWASVT